MSEQLNESFSWLVPLQVGDTKGKRITIRGKALFPTVSRNLRRYVDEELKRAARTLAKGWIDVNHEYSNWLMQKELYDSGRATITLGPKPVLKGNLEDAEYEDGAIEYLGQVNHPEYFEKLKDSKFLTENAYIKKYGKKPIKAVSVDALYRRNIKDGEIKEPSGIFFNGLSLVEDPEQPGVEGTTIEVVSIQEIAGPPWRLLQTYLGDLGVATEVVEEKGRKVIDLKKGEPVPIAKDRVTTDEVKQIVAERSVSGLAPAEPIKEAVKEDKSAEEKTDGHSIPTAELPQAISPIPSETLAGQPLGQVKLEIPSVKLTEEETLLIDKIVEGKMRALRTEFYRVMTEGCDWGSAGYSSFDDCISKNADKGDPEAYCTSIMRSIGGETLEQKQDKEKAEALKALDEKHRREKEEAEKASMKSALGTLKIKFSEAEKLWKENDSALTGTTSILRKDVNSLKETVESVKASTESALKPLGELTEKFAKLSKDLEETNTKIPLLVKAEEEKKEVRETFRIYQEGSKEGLENAKKIPKIEEDLAKAITRLENLEAHQKPSFKAKAEPPQSPSKNTPTGEKRPIG